ncbi:TonB-dependent receptor plug domain-containing protein [Thalassotalea maritima]|uniref:TonB-dependent receptor plug domain-containing protein n=1 Tax=Thalassotalea maritima TaxID=3242416 RepID=UPI00352732D8
MSQSFKLRHLTLAVGMALASQPTWAADAEDSAADENIEQIVVVGSRAAPRSVADSPVPVDVISSDELAKSGSSDMLDMLQSSVPSFNVRAQPISDAATLIRPVNLRGLSSDSTLVLVNGKRRHRASVIAFQGGGVNDGAQGPDISVIPAAALKQVEVLRDGASAQYGSDAIAGVMNFILRDDSEGGSISVKYGEYAQGDNGEDGGMTVIDGNIGLPFTDDGFANFSFQLKNADPTSRSVQRPDAANLIAQGNTSVADPAQIWGNPEVKDDITLFANIGLEVAKGTEAYLFGNYAERDVTGGFYYRNPHNRSNVYSVDGGETLLVGDVGLANGGEATCAVVPIPKNADGSDGNVLETDDYAAMVADPNCFSMNQIFPGGYTPQFGGNITDTSLTAGVRGDIYSGWLTDWSFDLSASVGRNESAFLLKNSLNPSLGLSTPTDFETGKYIQLEKTVNLDLVRAFDVGMAEDLNLAMGAEWREESFEIVAGEESSWKAGPYAAQGFNIGSHGFKGFGPESQGVNVRRNVALYIDAETYLTETWMVGAALRFEDYSTFGDTLDYKLATQLELTDSVSLRASHSTGFRAPTVGQANVVNTQTSMVEGELIQSFLAPPTNPLSAFYGGKELTPEESTSFSAGLVYQQGDFFMTIDGYSIEVTDRLAQSSQIDVLSKDHAELRARGVSNPGLISAVTFFNNDFDTTTEGVDVVANYSTELMDGYTKFSLAYNFNDTTVDSFNPETTNEGKVKRLEDGIPAHQATFTVSQSWDQVSAFVRMNAFGEYYAVHADDTSAGWSEMADSAVTFDAEVSWYATDDITVSFGGSNIFDQDAQELQKGDGGAYGIVGGKYYESGPFDYNGSFYYVKASYSF